MRKIVFLLALLIPFAVCAHNLRLKTGVTTVRSVTEEITRQTGILFSFSQAVGSTSLRPVNADLKKASTEAVCKAVFSNAGLQWKIQGDFVDLVLAEVTTDSQKPSDSSQTVQKPANKRLRITGIVKDIADRDPLVGVFVRSKNDGWKDISDPSIKIVGAKSGTTSEDSVIIISDMNKVESIFYTDYESLFKALENDEIDAAVADELLAKSFVDSYADIMTIGQPLSAEVYAIAVCPSNTELLQTLNNGLNELRRNGTLDQIVLDNLMR